MKMDGQVLTATGQKVGFKNLGNSQYVPVSEKIRECILLNGVPGYSMLEANVKEVNGSHFYQVKIQVGESTFFGTAQIRFDSNKGADKTDPFENAETSAVGRALALAGFGIIGNGSIASAEDLERVLSTPKPTPHNPKAKHNQQYQKAGGITSDQKKQMGQLLKMANVAQPSQLIKEIVNRDIASYDDLTEPEAQKVIIGLEDITNNPEKVLAGGSNV